jgi:two-component system, NarL family, sensor histidine kinase DesK
MNVSTVEIERLKPLGRRAFVPWLFTLTGNVKDLFEGDTPLPWLGGAGVVAFAFVALYTAAVFTGLD